MFKQFYQFLVKVHSSDITLSALNLSLFKEIFYFFFILGKENQSSSMSTTTTVFNCATTPAILMSFFIPTIRSAQKELSHGQVPRFQGSAHSCAFSSQAASFSMLSGFSRDIGRARVSNSNIFCMTQDF